jgi:hypothetical protein
MNRRLRSPLDTIRRFLPPGPKRQVAELSFGLDGRYDFSAGRITGWVVDETDPDNRNLTVSITRGSDLLLQVQVAERNAGPGWRFQIDTGNLVTGRELLDEAVNVTVSDKYGGYKPLRIEGSTQLDLIREYVDGAIPPYLTIDFGEDGNCREFMLDGWSGPEQGHTWTTGPRSVLAFTPPDDPRDYLMELLLWPFIVEHRHPEQKLEIWLNDSELDVYVVSRQSYLSCRMPASLLSRQARAVVRFEHPNAARPCDFGLSEDHRDLGLAFKKLKIVAVTDH